MECLHSAALLFLCCRLARSSAQDSDVFFFVAFSIAVDLKLKVFLCSVAAPLYGCVKVGAWRDIIDCVERHN